jgi:hypothetical protein
MRRHHAIALTVLVALVVLIAAWWGVSALIRVLTLD